MTLLEQLRAQLRAQLDARSAHEASIDTIISTVETRGDTALTDAETAQMAELRTQIKAIDEARPALEARIADLQARAESRAAAEHLAATLPTAEVRSVPVGGAVVRNEARTYRPDVQASYFSDLYARQFRVGDVAGAEQRLGAHEREVAVERRDIAVSAMAGAVPPQYLLDQFAPVAKAGRPFLNSLNSMPLPPDGVSFVIPRGTTGSAAAMTTEAAGFNEQDMANTDLTLTVNLVTAQQDISRTLFMRGGAVVDSIIFPDLLTSLAVAADVSAINGNGTAPQHRGVLQVSGISAVTYTDASPTVPELWPKISDAIQRINALRFVPGTAIFMHPRRWGWFNAALDTANRPLFNFSTTPPNVVMALGEAAKYGQIVGSLQGLPVITDANIPTTLGGGTEDIIIVANTQDFVFWEAPVMTFSFEQTISTAPGQVRLAAGQFQAFSAGRYPTGISTLGGTGLASPSF